MNQIEQAELFKHNLRAVGCDDPHYYWANGVALCDTESRAGEEPFTEKNCHADIWRAVKATQMEQRL